MNNSNYDTCECESGEGVNSCGPMLKDGNNFYCQNQYPLACDKDEHCNTNTCICMPN